MKSELNVLLYGYYCLFLLGILEAVQVKSIDLAKKDLFLLILLFFLQSVVFRIVYGVSSVFLKYRIHFYMFYSVFFFSALYLVFFSVQNRYFFLEDFYVFFLKIDWISKISFFLKERLSLTMFYYIAGVVIPLVFVLSLRFWWIKFLFYLIFDFFSLFISFFYLARVVF